MTQATADPDEPTPTCGRMNRTVWYRYEAPDDRLLFVDTIGSSFDTVVAVWKGTRENLTEIDCNDDLSVRRPISEVGVRTVRGAVYYIQVGGPLADAGALPVGGAGVQSLVFYLTDAVLPADNAVDALDISLPYDVRTHNGQTTVEREEPPCVGSQDGRPVVIPLDMTIWYRYTAVTNAIVEANTAGSEMATILVARSRSQEQLGCSADDQVQGSRLLLRVTRGFTYLFQIGVHQGSRAERIEFHVHVLTKSLNDRLEHATQVESLPFHTHGSLIEASRDITEPAGCLRSPRTIWYRYEAHESVAITADASGGVDPMVVAVFVRGPNGLRPIECGGTGRNAPHLALRVQRGRTYFFMVGSRGARGHLVDFWIHLGAPPKNDNVASAWTIKTLPFWQRTSTVWATIQPDEPRPCAAITGTLWYGYRALYSGDITVTAESDSGHVRGDPPNPEGIGFPLVLAAYPGDNQRRGVPIGCNWDAGAILGRASVTFSADQGHEYLIQVGGLASPYWSGHGSVRVEVAPGPSKPKRPGRCAASTPDPAPGAGLLNEWEEHPGRRNVHHSFDTSDEGFSRNDRQWSHAGWNPAEGRLMLHADRRDVEDETFAGTLPEVSRPDRDFTVSAVWQATAQGNAQHAIPLFIGSTQAISGGTSLSGNIRGAPSIAGIYYYSRNYCVGERPDYSLFYNSAKEQHLSHGHWLAENTAYRVVFDFDAETRLFTIVLRSEQGDILLDSVSHFVGPNEFAFDAVGIASVGNHGLSDSTEEPTIDLWVDDIHVSYEPREEA